MNTKNMRIFVTMETGRASLIRSKANLSREKTVLFWWEAPRVNSHSPWLGIFKTLKLPIKYLKKRRRVPPEK
jgi:hypothetical protein